MLTENFVKKNILTEKKNAKRRTSSSDTLKKLNAKKVESPSDILKSRIEHFEKNLSNLRY